MISSEGMTCTKRLTFQRFTGYELTRDRIRMGMMITEESYKMLVNLSIRAAVTAFASELVRDADDKNLTYKECLGALDQTLTSFITTQLCKHIKEKNIKLYDCLIFKIWSYCDPLIGYLKISKTETEMANRY